jgi:hypothetical protein
LGNGKNNATLNMVQLKFSPGLGDRDGKMISTGNFGCNDADDTDTLGFLMAFIFLSSGYSAIELRMKICHW